MIAYFFSDAGLRFRGLPVIPPLFLNFELPVTYLMVMLSIMQPNPAPDNTDIHWTTKTAETK